MKCQKCGAAMKPLMVSWFCPNDCDRKTAIETQWVKADPEYDMTSHVWVANNKPLPIGTNFVLGSGELMFDNSADAIVSLGKFGMYALLLSGIDGASVGWVVPYGPFGMRSYLYGTVVKCKP